jgi:Rps23 Pro-64 3,4-dihydroxylase Tpa1-like proline 4-hydroxylase
VSELHQPIDGSQARGLILPYIVLRDFLDEETVAGLLDYAISHQSDFEPTEVGRTFDPSYRVSMVLRGLGSFRPILQTKLFDLMPSILTKMRVKPIEEPKLETQLVAHGDGAFYKRHTDTLTDKYHDAKQIRMLSGIYYFNAEPKAFTGGALRLHAIGGKEGENFVDIEPVRNSLLVFLAWAPHEVLPVSCPSKRFIDSRFAVNCWVHGKKPETP